MINKIMLRRYTSAISVVIFMFIFGLINMLKPSFMYNDDFTFRQFGLGYKNKTIIPIWLVAIVVAFLSYLAVMYFISTPGIKF